MKIPGIFSIFLLFPLSVNASILFSEISWMGTSKSSYDEWIELRNNSFEEVNLYNWKIEALDGTPEIYLKGKIPGKSFFLLERTDDTTTPILADQIYTGSLSNKGERLFLKDSSGDIVDKTDSFWVAGENKSKKTMERYDAFTWKTSLEPEGTPRAKNSQENFPQPFAKANYFLLKINEVSPTKLKNEDEWFEFYVEANGYLDLTEIEFIRGKYQKKLKDVLHLLEWNEKDFPDGNISGKTLKENSFPNNRIIFLPKTKTNFSGIFSGYLSFSKSPFSLPDKGGEILVKDSKGIVLDTFSYPKTTKKKTPDYEYTEVWNRDTDTNEIYPLLYNGELFLHTKNKLNAQRPVHQDGILISELGINRKNSWDFIELFVTKDTNLKYLELVYKGKSLWFMPNNYEVKKGDFILLYTGNKTPKSEEKNIHIFPLSIEKLSIYSSTLSLNTLGRTSSQTPIDFVCWKNKKLSKSETKKLQKFIGNNWNGECFETNDIEENESIARKEKLPDENNSQDFFRHFIGSPGILNTNPSIFNISPHPHIKIQSISSNSINLTGEYSYDHNGEEDIKKFEWSTKLFHKKNRIWKKFLSDKKNPGSFSFSHHKNFSQQKCNESFYKIYLNLSDSSGISNKKSKKIPLYWNKKCELVQKINNEKFQEKVIPQKNSKEIYNPKNYFSEFLDLYVSEKQVLLEEIIQIKEKIYHRDRFFERTKISKEKLRKNIGLILEY